MYDRAYPEMLSSAPPGKAIQWALRSPFHFYCLCNRIKKFLEESTKVKETNVLTTFCNKSLTKKFSQSKRASKLLAVHITQPVPQFKRYASL